jgi:3D (Asp-Asp-Asp) domain-containing protein
MCRISIAILIYLIVAKVDALANLGGQESSGPVVTGVRTTAYTYGAAENGAHPRSNAIGKPLKAGKVRSAAADWSRWPLGTRFRVVETGQEYVIDDIGSAMVGTGTIDLFKPSGREMSRWGVRKVTIEILEWGSPEKSLDFFCRARNRVMCARW